MNIELPVDVLYILNSLNNKGYESYIVGGCVRDILLKKTPKDWDVVTSAKPGEIQDIFPRTFDVGIKHGTVVVPIHGENYEISTFRLDEGELKDIKTDLSKRDFTINAIAYSHDKGLIDPFSGRLDLEAKSIKCVESPIQRFSEDPLRMLRAIRFAAQLDFEIEKETLKTIKDNYLKINNISAERIREEISKILLYNPFKLILMEETGLMKCVLPEFHECFGVRQNHPYHIYDVAHHTINAISNGEKDFLIRWTMLFHDLGKPLTRTLGKDGYDHFYGHQEISSKLAHKIMNRLKFDNHSMDDIMTLIEYHDNTLEPDKRKIRKLMSQIGKGLLLKLIQVQRADSLAQNRKLSSDKIKNLAKLIELIDEVEKNNECVSLKTLDIDGKDLIQMGMSPSKDMGIVLEELLSIVIEDPNKNNKETLKSEAVKIINNLNNDSDKLQ
jgi:tRNA nucleotidyltransferase (CCA-adding enzyme)